MCRDGLSNVEIDISSRVHNIFFKFYPKKILFPPSMNQSCSKTWGKCNFSSLDSFEEKFAISFKNNEKYSYSPKRKNAYHVDFWSRRYQLCKIKVVEQGWFFYDYKRTLIFHRGHGKNCTLTLLPRWGKNGSLNLNIYKW